MHHPISPIDFFSSQRPERNLKIPGQFATVGWPDTIIVADGFYGGLFVHDLSKPFYTFSVPPKQQPKPFTTAQ